MCSRFAALGGFIFTNALIAVRKSCIIKDSRMSNSELNPVLLRLSAREAELGEGMMIRRALPNRQKRMIGAWCFLDHAGPADVSSGAGMRVGPHPHTGLQTFTWMIDGEFLHRDSLGYEQLVRPGQVNLMTAGRGISHSEESPAQRSPRLQAAQLWIALPDEHRFCEPAFDHYPELPVIHHDGFRLTVLVGEMLEERAPTHVYSPLVGVDMVATEAAIMYLPLRPDFEYGVLVLEGEAVVAGESLTPGTLLYLGSGRTELALDNAGPVRLLLIGGEPFNEEVLLWWNFVGRTQDEMVEYTRLWNTDEYFGEVKGYQGNRLVAPPLPEGVKVKS
jgi:redox-sensitive bicupin YhaK (pirin superfamily)